MAAGDRPGDIHECGVDEPERQRDGDDARRIAGTVKAVTEYERRRSGTEEHQQYGANELSRVLPPHFAPTGYGYKADAEGPLCGRRRSAPPRRTYPGGALATLAACAEPV